MKDFVDICNSGSLTIRGRGGIYQYDSLVGSTKNNCEHSIGVTLIEWEIELP